MGPGAGGPGHGAGFGGGGGFNPGMPGAGGGRPQIYVNNVCCNFSFPLYIWLLE